MNPDTITESIQKGFRVTLGAASFLVETIQDPVRRDENLAKLQNSDFAVLSEEWAIEGEKREQEARSFVDSVIAQQQGNQPNGSATNISSGMPSSVTIPIDLQSDLRELIVQLAELRVELQHELEQNS
ncbi:MAG: hypothetical protein VKK04_10795 [Synechococcales bacterium]|nr:hypothetical protein [Synechococcales bacterium]